MRILLLVLALLASPLGAQREVYTWRSFTRADGLPSNGVQDVLEASDGRIWVACYGGVGVYDGRSWQTIRAVRTEAGASVDLDLATCLAESSDGTPQGRRIWIGTNGNGVLIHDPRRNTWRALDRASSDGELASDNVRAILIAADGSRWFGLDGAVSRLDARGRWQTFDEESGLPIGHRPVYTIYEDPRRHWVWVAGYHFGLHCWRGTHWIHYSERGVTDDQGRVLAPTRLPGSYVYSVACDAAGDLWLATVGGGVACLSSASEFTELRAVRVELACRKVTGITRGADDSLWFSTFEGLTRWDPLENRSQTFRPGEDFSSGFFRRAYYGPRRRALWFASFGGGLVAYLPTGFLVYGQAEFDAEERDLRGGLAIAPDGRVWGASRRSVFRLDHDEQRTTFTRFGFRQLGFEDREDKRVLLQCIYTEKDGSVWVGSNLGLSVGRAGRWQRVPVQIDGKELEPFIWSVFRDREDRLWVTTESHGVLCCPGRNSTRWTQITTENSPLPHRTVYAIFQDSRRDIWLGTMRGVMRMRYAHGPGAEPRWDVFTTREGLSMDRVYSIQQSGDGRMWFGGLRAVDTWKDGVFQHVRGPQSQGQIEDGIYCFRIIKTRDGSLWFAIQGVGLVRYSQPNLWTTLNGPQGLVGNAAGVAEGEDGVLWIATGRGLVSYTPEGEPPSVSVPANNPRTLPSDGAGIFFVQGQDAFHRTPSMELRFRYRLDDTPWSEYQRDARFFLHGLAPGDHAIQFQAIDRDLNSSGIASYRFSVQRPWWQTPWVWGLAAGIILTIFATWLIARALEEKRRQVLLNAESVSAAVTHFVRDAAHGGVTLPAAGEASADTAFGRLESYAQVLQRGLQLIPAVRVSQIAEELLREYREKTSARIHFDLIVDRNEPTASLDPDKIRLALDHLLCNAVDALLESAGGRIRIQIQRRSGLLRKTHLILRVEDDGPGIPEEVSRRLRTPFNAMGKRGHMGLGLFHVHQIANLHRGELRLLPRPGGGTSAEIVLPVNLA